MTEAEADLLALMAAAPGPTDLREYLDRRMVAACTAAKWIQRATNSVGYLVTERGRRALARHAIAPTQRRGRSGAEQAQSSAFWRQSDPELRRLFASGLPVTSIAEKLGKTKNAVIGRIHRLGLERGVEVLQTQGQLASAKANETKRDEPAQAQARADARRIIFPQTGCCVWPHGDPGASGFRFCGDQVAIPGAPYCHEHMLEGHVPASKRADAMKQINWAAGRIGWKESEAA